MSKTVLMKLLVGGGITAALATGGYYLTDGLGRKNRSRTRRELSERKNSTNNDSNLKMNEDNTEWELIFKSSVDKAVCRKKGLGEEEFKDPGSQGCESEWMKRREQEVESKDELRLRIKKNIFGSYGEDLNHDLKERLKKKMEELNIGHTSEVDGRKECSLNDRESNHNGYYEIICKK